MGHSDTHHCHQHRRLLYLDSISHRPSNQRDIRQDQQCLGQDQQGPYPNRRRGLELVLPANRQDQASGTTRPHQIRAPRRLQRQAHGRIHRHGRPPHRPHVPQKPGRIHPIPPRRLHCQAQH